jgi:class 3 adenylate cyclase
MLTWLRAAWERLSDLGTGNESPGERRRVRLTNQAAVIGSVSCGSFALGYTLIDARVLAAPIAANVFGVVSLLAALALNARGRRLLARALVLLPVNIVVVVASMLLGGRVGFVYYCVLFAAVAFMLFPASERLLRFAFFTLSAVSCVIVRLVAPKEAELALRLGEAADATLDIISALAVIATVGVVVHLFTADTERAEDRLAAEHDRSEKLLLNILPSSISARLKSDGESIADGFAEVSVLFADIVGFTELSQRLSPDALVRMLNRIFSAFDDLAERLGLEKIKTIGDAYMVACGLPLARADHAQAIARMALEMQRALAKLNAEEGYGLQVRIGMHSGPVVAGVIGKRKFIYDLWGDTVNTASRMESSGLPGAIQVTAEVFERLRGEFEFEPRGAVSVKGMGEMQTYLLLGEKTAKSPQ